MLKYSKGRQEVVLELIVNHYIENAQPVGSRFVARELGLSSATIRNVMADLEDLGFIAQPHTSAGRVPTDKGYRYYIDSLMRVRRINESMARSVKEQYNQVMRTLEDVMERTAHLMSSLTHYVGLTLFSQYHKLYLDGASHIIEHPEFKNFKKLYAILRSLEEKRDILNLLSGDFEDDSLRIHIGKENRFNYLSECSVVTMGYRLKGKPSGRIGVIGPKRMAYEKVIPTVEFLAATVSNILEELEIQ